MKLFFVHVRVHSNDSCGFFCLLLLSFSFGNLVLGNLTNVVGKERVREREKRNNINKKKNKRERKMFTSEIVNSVSISKSQ